MVSMVIWDDDGPSHEVEEEETEQYDEVDFGCWAGFATDPRVWILLLPMVLSLSVRFSVSFDHFLG